MDARKTGVCKWFSAQRGYGFIASDEGGDVYVHYTGLVMDGFRTLREGDAVEFTLEDSERGPMAVDVVVTGRGTAA